MKIDLTSIKQYKFAIAIQSWESEEEKDKAVNSRNAAHGLYEEAKANQYFHGPLKEYLREAQEHASDA